MPTKESLSPASLPVPLSLSVDRAGPVPAVAWLPTTGTEAVVLVCHGGSGHKKSPTVTNLACALLPHGIAVVAIDGPVHGERRLDGNLDPTVAKAAFRDAWRAGVGVTDMARDLSAAIDCVEQHPQLRGRPLGYIGVSMGTAYGLPLLAEDSRIRAAAIGLWSTTYPASGHLAEYARRVKCPIWFTQQWNDEFFERAGTAELFDAIGSKDKRLVAYSGPHRELEGERITDAVNFICSRLLA